MGMQNWRRNSLFLLNYLSGAMSVVRCFWRGEHETTHHSQQWQEAGRNPAPPWFTGMAIPRKRQPEGAGQLKFQQISTGSGRNTAGRSTQIEVPVPPGFTPPELTWSAPQRLNVIPAFPPSQGCQAEGFITEPTWQGGKEVRKKRGAFLFAFFFFNYGHYVIG